MSKPLKKALSALSASPLKGLGQNFLKNPDDSLKIISFLGDVSGETVVEIGPGLGALTKELLRKAGKLIAIEKDNKFALSLSEELKDFPAFTLIHRDCLDVDYEGLFRENGAMNLIGNLPYNISTPLLFLLLERSSCFKKMILMFQKEVALRLAAKPDTSDYGALTVLTNLYCDAKIEIILGPEKFYPSPKIDSAVVSFTVLKEPRFDVKNEALFKKIVKSAFQWRRKTLVNALKHGNMGFESDKILETLEKSGINPERRGETLSLKEFVNLANNFVA